jgi:adenosylhomocysteine nucleosidase
LSRLKAPSISACGLNKLTLSVTFPRLHIERTDMARETIGLIAAMPDEISPLLKQLRKHDKTTLRGFPLYRFTVAGNHCSLIESGMGPGRAQRAAEALIESIHPDLLISFGFCGAVMPGLSAGDLAVARRSILYREDTISSGNSIELPASSKAMRIMGTICEKSDCKVVQSDFITSEIILNKKELRDILPIDIANPVLDMETWAVARIAGQGGIPILAIRAVSDSAEEELEFSLDQFVDSEMNIRIGRILRAIARKPRIIPQLLRLAKNAKIAGRNLAVALDGLLGGYIISSGPSDIIT